MNTDRQQARVGRDNNLGPWLRRGLLGLLGLLIILALAGATYQVVGTRIDQRKYPPPGRMVDVGGYKLHMYCIGKGTPTVILDHVADTNSAQWGLIQPVVAGETQVCAYDRAGFGWSESGPPPRDARHSAQELHALLTAANVPAPYVLVGHSYGANVARVFAADYPDHTAGLVLVDPGIAYDRPGVPADVNEQWKTGYFIVRAAPALTHIGAMRLAATLGALPGHGDLPPAQGEAYEALQLTARFRQAVRDQDLRATSPQVLAAEQHLREVPLVVLSAEEPQNDRSRQVWTDVNAGIAASVPNGVHRVVPGSDHMSLVLKQEHAQVTSAAILDVVEAARMGQPLVQP